MDEEIDLVEVALREIQASEGVGAQIMILEEVAGARQFPIFIGPNEMDALDRAIHQKEAVRPLTHDLILNVVEAMKGELVRVLVDDLHDDTFFGKLVVRLSDGAEVYIDSRPSDAMVLAARRGVQIFVAEKILENIGQPPEENDLE